MFQRIEKQQENKLPEVVVTVMFHDGRLFSDGNESLLARVGSAPSLSGSLIARSHCVSSAPSPSGLVNASPERRRAHSPSLSHTEKFPAEASMYHSALAVSAANPNMCSLNAVAIATFTMTEHRRRAAA